MRLSLLLSILCLTIVPASAQRFVKVFDNIAALLAANPNDVHTNAYVTGHTTANDGRGGIYTWNSASTAATNENLSVLKANNFATGRWFRDNGFVLSNFTTNTVVVVGPNGILTNSVITITELNSLVNIGGNIQQQINNLIALDTNWENDGATNANLVGIGRLWQIIATNSVQVGQPGEAGYIDIYSTNGTYAASLSVDPTGAFTILSLGDPAGTAFIINSSNTVTFPGLLLDAQSAGDSKFQITEEGGVLADDDIRVEDPGDVSRFALLEHDALRVTDKLSLYPRQADGFTPYLMDTFLTHTSGSMLQVLNLGTLEFNVAANSGYTGGGTLFLADDGTYKSVTSGAGITNININPTDSYLPYRSNATVFGDSSFFQDPAVSTNVAFDSQLLSYGLGAGTANYERLMIDHQGAGGVVFDSQAGGSGTVRNQILKFGGTPRYAFGATGTITMTPASTNDYIYYNLGAFYTDGSGRLELNSDGGSAEVYIVPWDTSLPFYFSSARTVAGATALFSLMNNHTSVFGIHGGGDVVMYGTNVTVAGVNVLTRSYGATASDLTTPLVAGTVKGIIRLPHAMTLTEVRASLLTAQTSGATFTVDIEENGTTILSTPITIDNGDTSSEDATTPPVISDTALADDAIITLDITQVGDGTAVGLQFWITGTIAP